MSEVLTPDALRATIAAGQVPVLPKVMSPAESQAAAIVMRELMDERAITAVQAGMLLGYRSKSAACSLAKRYDIKTSDAVLAAVRARNAIAGRAVQQAKHQALRIDLDAKVQALREQGKTHAEMKAELGINRTTLERSCTRLGAVNNRSVANKAAWAKRKAARTDPTFEERRRAKVEENRQRRVAMVRQIAELLGEGLNMQQVARQMGVNRKTVEGACAKYQLRAAAAPKPKPAPEPEPRAPLYNNPFLTPAQRANVDVQRGVLGRRFNSKKNLPPPTREEADRAVAEFLARRSVTVCPPAARIETPCNAGVMWDYR